MGEELSRALPPEFLALAEAMAPSVRALLVDNVPPESIECGPLLTALGLQASYAEHTHKDLRSLTLLRLARGLPPEPPRTHARQQDILHFPQALTPTACAALRGLFERCDAVPDAPDSVDGAPDHQIDLKGTAALAAVIGSEETTSLLLLVDKFNRQESLEIGQDKLKKDTDGADAAQDSVALPSEIFVRRYSASTRPWLNFHCDRARCTINVALSHDADRLNGGRLLAIVDGGVTAIDRCEGDATLHSSRLCHAVSRMLPDSGQVEEQRFSLIIFFA
jgi:hypothetical protein